MSITASKGLSMLEPWGLRSPISLAQFLHRLHQRNDVFNGSPRQNPVTQIEDVTRATAGLGKDPACLGADGLDVRKESDRVEVPHDRYVPEATPGFVQVHPPVQPDDLPSSFLHHLYHLFLPCSAIDHLN